MLVNNVNGGSKIFDLTETNHLLNVDKQQDVVESIVFSDEVYDIETLFLIKSGIKPQNLMIFLSKCVSELTNEYQDQDDGNKNFEFDESQNHITVNNVDETFIEEDLYNRAEKADGLSYTKEDMEKVVIPAKHKSNLWILLKQLDHITKQPKVTQILAPNKSIWQKTNNKSIARREALNFLEEVLPS